MYNNTVSEKSTYQKLSTFCLLIIGQMYAGSGDLPHISSVGAASSSGQNELKLHDPKQFPPLAFACLKRTQKNPKTYDKNEDQEIHGVTKRVYEKFLKDQEDEKIKEAIQRSCEECSVDESSETVMQRKLEKFLKDQEDEKIKEAIQRSCEAFIQEIKEATKRDDEFFKHQEDKPSETLMQRDCEEFSVDQKKAEKEVLIYHQRRLFFGHEMDVDGYIYFHRDEDSNKYDQDIETYRQQQALADQWSDSAWYMYPKASPAHSSDSKKVPYIYYGKSASAKDIPVVRKTRNSKQKYQEALEKLQNNYQCEL